jgi:hypothetical protein
VPNQPLYPNAKPVDGDVLILCEGDAVGYESKLLKAWADGTDLTGRFVKVFACGTSTAFYGVADAIGRTVPIIIVEDRDFRTIEEARTECNKQMKNREGRSIAMHGWVAWRRAEIENYFTDDALLPSVFAEVFDCTPDAVRDAVRSALGLLSVSQALEYALYRARKSWLSTDANRALRVESLKWSAAGQTALPAEEVKAKLEKRLIKWQQSLHDGTTWEDPMAGQQLLADFEAKCSEWAKLTYEDVAWRRDWACKEVVKRVRMTLTQTKPGWWSVAGISDAPVVWTTFKDDKERDEHDRFIERTVQPMLVTAVVERLKTDAGFDLRMELDDLAAIIRKV